MGKILWATTFREFNSTKNDNIQNNFLNSIAMIEDVDVHLYVTTFGEKNVIDNIKKFNDKAVVIDSRKDLDTKYRYSQSIVLNNALHFYLKNFDEYNCIVWSTCDIVVPKKIFSFEKLSRNFEFIGTTHPNNILDDYGFYSSYQMESGGDLFFFKNLSRENIRKLIELNNNYPNYDYGIYEQFLVAASKIMNIKLLNFYNDIRLIKYENNRMLTNETNDWIKNSWKNNQKTMIKMLNDNSMSKFYAYNMTFCVIKFKNINNSNIFKRFYRVVYATAYLLIRSIYKKYIKKIKINFFEIF